MKNALVVLAASLSLSGCVTTRVPSTEVRALTLCNAGLTAESSAKLTAKVEERLRDGLSFDANFKDSLKGDFVPNAKVTEANSVALYNRYLECLDEYLKSKPATGVSP